jgi:hypothetical protein
VAPPINDASERYIEEGGAVEETTPPWRDFVPLDVTDAARLANFRYQALSFLWGEWRVDL